MSEPVLKVKDFTVEFWVDGTWYPAAVDMNFEVNPGQVLAIVGESGSGKSTTAMGLMSLLATNARMYGSVGGEKIYAWAAQAPGRYHSRTVHATEVRGLQIPDTNSMRAGESPRSHSGVAVALARIRHGAFAKSQTVGATYRSDFNVTGLVTLVLLFAVATLLTFF